MIDVTGSLESRALPVLLVFLANLGQSGRLRVTRGPFAGQVDFEEGRVTAASFGADHGLDALEGIVLAPDPAQFNFTPGQANAEGTPLDLGADELERHLNLLEPRRLRIAAAVPSLSARVWPLETALGPEDEALTLQRRHFSLLFSLGERSTVRAALHGRPLAHGVETLVDLVEAGLIAIEPHGHPPVRLRAIRARRLPRLRLGALRNLLWTALGLFIGVSLVAQGPDIARQFVASFQPQHLTEHMQAGGNPAPPGGVVSAVPPTTDWPSDPSRGFWLSPEGYHLAPRAGASFVMVSPPVSTYAMDLDVGARFQKLDGPGPATYGLVIRSQASSPSERVGHTGRFLLFAINDDGQTTVRRWDGDSWVDSDPGRRAQTSESQSSYLGVRALGGHVTFRINGVDSADIEDPSPQAGSIALYLEGEGTHVLINDFTITVG